jgi:uncharacterized protein (TIGR02996 family)
MEEEEEHLLAAMRAAPDDARPRLVFADWLLARGDARGELIALDHRARTSELSLPQVDRLLELSAEHGFPHLPDDPCASILRFTGGGSHPTQYETTCEGHHYYLRHRYGFSITVDDGEEIELELNSVDDNQWTFRETTVILSIVSEAIVTRAPIAGLRFPDEAELRAHPRFHVGRAPLYDFPAELVGARERGWLLELRDYSRWYGLWRMRQRLLGRRPDPVRTMRCACGAPELTCRVPGCS